MSELNGWERATLAQRINMLQALENQQAVIQKRPAAEVKAQAMPTSHRGYYSRSKNQIVINQDMVSYSQSPQRCLQNLYHEGRHAFQWHAINHPERHPELSKKIQVWTDNFRNYKSYNKHKIEQDVQRASKNLTLTPKQTDRLSRKATKSIFESYYNQPLERDARAWAQQLLSQGKSQGRTAQRQGPAQAQAQSRVSASRVSGPSPAVSPTAGHTARTGAHSGAVVGGVDVTGGHGASTGGRGGHGASTGGHGGHGAPSGGHSR